MQIYSKYPPAKPLPSNPSSCKTVTDVTKERLRKTKQLLNQNMDFSILASTPFPLEMWTISERFFLSKIDNPLLENFDFFLQSLPLRSVFKEQWKQRQLKSRYLVQYLFPPQIIFLQ